jgi:spore coat polysaccharide biosynthesis protein SpsF
MIAAIIQARMTSSRLAGKVLRPILDVPMLGRQIERVRNCKTIDQIVVATSVHASDDVLAGFCQDFDTLCIRGDLDDVLGRYHLAANETKADTIVRLTGDCPLSDPDVIDSLVKIHASGNFDYVSNTIVPTYPDGLDAEICSRQVLETAYREATVPSDREHVTPYIKNSSKFSKYNLVHTTDLSHLRWTVDEAADFELVTKIYENLYPQLPGFGMLDILSILDQHPEWLHLNSEIVRDEGYAKSLRQDTSHDGK